MEWLVDEDFEFSHLESNEVFIEDLESDALRLFTKFPRLLLISAEPNV